MAYIPIWQTARLTLTSAQVKTLHGTPVQIIPTPGSGLGIVLAYANAKLNYGGNNAFTAGAAQAIGLFYNNTTTDIIADTTFIPNAMITNTANAFTVTSFTITSLVNKAAGVLDNVNIAIYNPVATEISGNAAGDNTIDITVIYAIVPF
jgi:hypothetical protein